ncbi:MAG: PA0069 family radical SAM protein [Planctomycetota bacterium]
MHGGVNDQDRAHGGEGFEYRDALPDAAPGHRRASGLNPGNRFEVNRVHQSGEFLDYERQEREQELAESVGPGGKPLVGVKVADVPGGGRVVPLQVFSDQTKSIINRVTPTSDVPFDWTVSPYRGCEHGCIYCFARPYHEYLGFSLGEDFETKLVAKYDAPKLLEKALAKRAWKPEPIVMSAITDIYQPIEKELRIARGCLEVLADCRQPVTTMTKNTLVLRDTELWAELSAINAGRVTVTLVTLDAKLAEVLEPRASSPIGRLRVIRELSKAGVNVSVNIAPVIPGLTDHEMPEIMERIAEAGTKRVAWVMLRLPYQLKALFLGWLQRHVPDRAARVESLLRQAHGGKLYNAKQGQRGRGRGAIAANTAKVFDVCCRRYGLNRDVRPLSGKSFRRPETGGQMGLF